MTFINGLAQVGNGLTSNDGSGDGLRSGATKLNGNSSAIQGAINALAAAQTAGGKSYKTKALLDADLSPVDGTIALVWGDASPSNNQSWIKEGASNVGVWSKATDRLAQILGNGAGFQQDGDGAVVLDFQAALRAISVSTEQYGAAGDDSSDDTTALQKAIASAGGRTIVFAPGKTYRVGVLTIDQSVTINGNGAFLKGTADAIFKLAANVGYVKISGFAGVTFIDPATGSDRTGTHGREFFTTAATANVTGYVSTGTFYEAARYEITGNNLGAAKVKIRSALTSTATPFVDVSKNDWQHGSGQSIVPAYLELSLGSGSGTQTQSDFVQVIGNRMKVFAVTGSNKDIVKSSGGICGLKMRDNHWENTNPASEAQVDIFTGQSNADVSDNTFKNVQLMRKQDASGDLAGNTIVQKHTNIRGNHFIVDAGFNAFDSGVGSKMCMVLHGSFFNALHNTFDISRATGDKVTYCAIIYAYNAVYDSLNLKGSYAFRFDYNTADLRNSADGNTARFVCSQQGDPRDWDQDFSISNNIVYGGDVFWLTSFPATHNPKRVTLVHNRWAYNSGATTAAIVIGDGPNFVEPNDWGSWTGELQTPQQIHALDDHAYSFVPQSAVGMLQIICAGSTAHSGLVLYNVAATGATTVKVGGGASLDVATGALAGTTGTDAHVTVSAHTDGKIYIENRFGSSRFIKARTS